MTPEPDAMIATGLMDDELLTLRDTIEALIEERAGDKSIDAPEWLSFAQWAASQAPADSESWVRRQVAFRQNGDEVMEKVFRPSTPAP